LRGVRRKKARKSSKNVRESISNKGLTGPELAYEIKQSIRPELRDANSDIWAALKP